MKYKFISVWLSNFGHYCNFKVPESDAWYLEYIIVKAGYTYTEFDMEELEKLAKEREAAGVGV